MAAEGKEGSKEKCRRGNNTVENLATSRQRSLREGVDEITASCYRGKFRVNDGVIVFREFPA